MRTVADIVAELLKLPQDLPVLAGCHYDNDDGLTDEVNVLRTYAAHSEARYWMDCEPGWPGATQVVVIA